LEKVLAVNFLGLRHLTEGVFPRIARGGAVVSVASIAGQDWQRRFDVVSGMLETRDFDEGIAWARANEPRWEKDAYTFSKQCVVAYTHRAAGLGLKHEVRVNSVSPGTVDTGLIPGFRNLVGEDHFQWMLEQTGGRMADPEEIAEVIAYLAIGPSRWVNGVDLVVDGGYRAGVLGGWVDVGSSPLGRRLASKRADRDR
jgi:NAD(P)-dependent dehydrogenase (short-subunit alcohol dehydrogenase family)